MSESVEHYETLARYETILENINDGVYMLDPRGRITWVNETAIEVFDIGYEREELIGSYVSKLLSEEDIEKCLDIIEACLESDDRNSGRCEIALQTAYGDVIPCDLHLTLLPMEDGEFQGTVGVVRDISERKRREQRLEVMNRVLRHNLRNDMNVIMGHAEILGEKLVEADERHIQSIIDVGTDLLDLSDKLRWLSEVREQAGASGSTIDVVERLRSIVSRFRDEYPTVEFEVDLPSDTAVGARVVSPELFDVAMRNLIENSIEHNETPHPHVTVSVQRVRGTTRISVADNGPGLPEQEREVLERGSETPLQHGSGLGLWLVYWCVTTVGGDLSFDSSSSRGTRVTLAFPAADVPDQRA